MGQKRKEGLKITCHSSSRCAQNNPLHKREREEWEMSTACGAEIEEEKRSGRGQSVPPRTKCPPQGHRLCPSVTEGLGLGKGHRGAGLGPSRCFLRSQEQQGGHGCGRYLIFFSREMGFTWLTWGQAQDLYYHLVKGMSQSTYTVKTGYIFSSCLWH